MTSIGGLEARKEMLQEAAGRYQTLFTSTAWTVYQHRFIPSASAVPEGNCLHAKLKSIG